MSNRINGQFAPRLIEMLQSPAYRALSRAAHQVLARIEIEHAHHGGIDNGKLPVTYAQLVEYGLHRNVIAAAIRELTALGFIKVTEQGRSGNADFRRPSKYRITYHQADRANPTHEWRRITEDDALMIAKGARRQGSNSAGRHTKKPANKNRKPHPKSVPSPPPESVPKPAPKKCTDREKIPAISIVQKVGVPLEGYPSIPEARASVQQPTGPCLPPDPWADLDIPEYLRR